MSETKVVPFRFTDEELEVLGVIEGNTGIRSRTEALKGVLREHARPLDPGSEEAEQASRAPTVAGAAAQPSDGEKPTR